MLPAFLTTIFFSLSALFAARSSRVLGSTKANLGRMAMALLFLGIWAHTNGQGVGGASFHWFLLSGIVGYGFGDLALFQALPRIGPRLTVLITHCLAVPIAAFSEFAWLGTRLNPLEIVCAAVVLCGVYVALTPVHRLNLSKGTFWIGALFGVGSALGQGGGAVITRKANQVAELAGMPIDGISAAYQRMIGGIFTAVAVTLLIRAFRPKKTDLQDLQNQTVKAPLLDARRKRIGWTFATLNAIAGPTIGVACFQWALSHEKSGVVLPIVAMTPVVTIPLAYWIDGDRPTLRSIVGGVIAVAGAVILAALRFQTR